LNYIIKYVHRLRELSGQSINNAWKTITQEQFYEKIKTQA